MNAALELQERSHIVSTVEALGLDIIVL